MKSFVKGICNRVTPVVMLAGLIYPVILSATWGVGSLSLTDVRSNSPASESDNRNRREDISSLIQNENNGLAAAIRTARYSIERSEDKFYASNPANEITAVFDRDGDLKLSSSDKKHSWQSDWQLKSIGRGSVQQSVANGEWSGSKTQISARHQVESPDGPILVEESLENRPDGLEQIFVVERSPGSRRPDSRAALRLVLEIGGDLDARASDDGQMIDLIDKTGEKILRYEKLKVWDANAIELRSIMRTEADGEVWLEVDDTGAVYPITVDPSFVQVQKLTRADSTAGDHFGEALAESSFGTFLAIGAPGAAVAGNDGQGAVYIFEYSPGTRTWTFKQKITASDGAAGDNFGSAIATGWQDSFLIGAPNDNIGANFDQGSVYKFQESSTTGVWSQSLKILATDGAPDDNFGSDILAVGIDSMFVSAPGDDVNDNANQGSVYWINQSTGAHRRRLNAADGQAGDAFGISIDGWEQFDDPYDTWLVVGAYRDDNGAATDQGSVYILQYDSSANTWTQPQKLLAPDGALGDNFGVVVKVASSFTHDLYVGATGDDIGGNSGQGSVYYYDRTSVYSYKKKITSNDGEPFDRFGSSIADYNFFDNTLVVGSPFADIGVNQNQGAVYFFTKRTINNDVVFRQSSKRSSPDGDDNDHFGSSVILASDRNLIVGSPDDDVDADVDQGSVSFMRRGAATADFDDDFESDLSIFRPSNGQWWYDGSNTSTRAAQFGTSTDRITPGDFTGDGRTDIALWRPSTGTWFVLRSENSTFFSFPFGTPTDIPVVGDFDADIKADASVFRPSTGTWYISRSSGGTTTQQFGANGDIPVVGDYNDDGRSDIAIFRPTNGQWWIQRSGGDGTIVHTFGVSTDKPVQADYTGDGKTDVAIFRPSTGFWFVLRSENASFYSAPFGTSTDLPAPADYDGDGKTDLAVFRPSDGNWYLNRTFRGNLIQQFGSAGDRPVPNAFVP